MSDELIRIRERLVSAIESCYDEFQAVNKKLEEENNASRVSINVIQEELNKSKQEEERLKNNTIKIEQLIKEERTQE